MKGGYSLIPAVDERRSFFLRGQGGRKCWIKEAAASMKTGGTAEPRTPFFWSVVENFGRESYIDRDWRKETPMKEKVEAALSKVRPALMADGGDVELVEVQDGVVKVRLTGACGGCPMSQMTLKMGIERLLRKEVPEIKEVIAV